MELKSVLESIENSREDMIKTMSDMIGIPSIAPVNGGDGESKRADMLQKCLVGYDSVIRVDVPDDLNPSVMRSNILAKKNGKEKGTVWIVAHTDTVPVGDITKWDSDPFTAVVKDGKIYGLGSEDNGQSIISSMFASRYFSSEDLTKKSIGIALVADEETTSKSGIVYLLEKGYFSEDDVFVVPDWGSPNGEFIEVAEKELIWLKFEVIGKTTHGSTPNKGQNAFRVGTYFLSELMSRFAREFNDTDEMFRPPRSTFEPTKSEITTLNVNTIPGKFEFYMDIRVIPKYSLDDVIFVAKDMAKEYERRTGITINVIEVQKHITGKPSSTDSVAYNALSESIESVIGKKPISVGIGRGTCANFFREVGLDAYVWQFGGGTLHAPNEHVIIDSMVIDAKVFATLFYKLCV